MLCRGGGGVELNVTMTLCFPQIVWTSPLSMSGDSIPWWEVSGTAFVDGLLPGAFSPFPNVGVVIALIDCTHQLFTYANEFFVAVVHRGMHKQGSTVFNIVLFEVVKEKGASPFTLVFGRVLNPHHTFLPATCTHFWATVASVDYFETCRVFVVSKQLFSFLLFPL